jgi:hypothetical protein
MFIFINMYNVLHFLNVYFYFFSCLGHIVEIRSPSQEKFAESPTTKGPFLLSY